MCLPMPAQPSIAQTRSGLRRPWASMASRSVPNRPPLTMVSSPVITSMVGERLCGSMPMTTRSAVELKAVLRCSIQQIHRAGR
jgi:hypothetical protein